jgi:hypothetical protein
VVSLTLCPHIGHARWTPPIPASIWSD